MHYTHNFHIIRHRRHTWKISIFILLLTSILAIAFGFTQLDALLFTTDFFYSLTRILISYAFALIIGLCCVLFITKTKRIEDISLPILDALQSFPAFAILPLLITFLGNKEIVIIVVLVIEMIWPILFSLLTGLKSVNPEILEASSIFKAGGWNKLIFVTLPILFPTFVTGSIVAWGEAWETILATEIILNIQGIGSFLMDPNTKNAASFQLIGLLLLFILLFLINKFIWISMLNKSTKYVSQ